MSYSVAVPFVPSSPGADQVNVAEESVLEELARSVTFAGAVVSDGGGGVTGSSSLQPTAIDRRSMRQAFKKDLQVSIGDLRPSGFVGQTAGVSSKVIIHVGTSFS